MSALMSFENSTNLSDLLNECVDRGWEPSLSFSNFDAKRGFGWRAQLRSTKAEDTKFGTIETCVWFCARYGATFFEALSSVMNVADDEWEKETYNLYNKSDIPDEGTKVTAASILLGIVPPSTPFKRRI